MARAPYAIHIIATCLHGFALIAVLSGLFNNVWVKNEYKSINANSITTDILTTTYTLWSTTATFSDVGVFTVSQTLHYDELLKDADLNYCSQQGPPYRNMSMDGVWIAPNGARRMYDPDPTTNGQALHLIRSIRVVLFFAFIGCCVDVLTGLCFMFGRCVTHRGITFLFAFIAGCLTAVGLGMFVYFNNLCDVLDCLFSRWNSCSADWKGPFGLGIGACVAKGIAAFLMIARRPRKIVEEERLANPVVPLLPQAQPTQTTVIVYSQQPLQGQVQQAEPAPEDPGYVYGKAEYGPSV